MNHEQHGSIDKAGRTAICIVDVISNVTAEGELLDTECLVDGVADISQCITREAVNKGYIMGTEHGVKVISIRAVWERNEHKTHLETRSQP